MKLFWWDGRTGWYWASKHALLVTTEICGVALGAPPLPLPRNYGSSYNYFVSVRFSL